MPRRVLVMGFGPFLTITDNPAARVAREIDGLTRGGVVFVGRIMPVSFDRAVSETLAAVEEIRPIALVGIGVARSRSVVTIEAIGRNIADGETPDVDGQCRVQLESDGPDQRAVTLPSLQLASRLGAVVGYDAGRYVCNAWLYQMLQTSHSGLPTGFIHIPPAGLQASRLADALADIEGMNHGTEL
ncbi:MAG: pyroglutamyl-peptidase [Myxococcota bacterium]